jgi:hypothetical protein
MRRWETWIFALALLAPALPASAADVELPRAGQVGISLQGGYGTMLETGVVGETFGPGPSYAIRLRYRMRYERGIGLSFENHSLEARQKIAFDPADPDSANPEKLSLILSGFEIYQLFGTRTRNVKLLSLGLGLAQLRTELNSDETELDGETSGDGLYLSAGAGIERFFYRTWAWDLSARYFAVFKDGEISHDLQAALGLVIYAGY